MEPISWAILAAIMMASMAGTSAVMANQAAKRNEEAQQAALALQQKQAADQASVEAEKVEQQAHQMESRIRVAAGESGIGLGGTFEALTRQTRMDESWNLNIINQNMRNAQLGIASQFQPQPRTNPLLAGIMGGLQGANMGMNLSSNLSGIQRTNALYAPPAPAGSFSSYNTSLNFR
ncbi:MAG: hypothetical protein WC683_06800 [bacterium]